MQLIQVVSILWNSFQGKYYFSESRCSVLDLGFQTVQTAFVLTSCWQTDNSLPPSFTGAPTPTDSGIMDKVNSKSYSAGSERRLKMPRAPSFAATYFFMATVPPLRVINTSFIHLQDTIHN